MVYAIEAHRHARNNNVKLIVYKQAGLFKVAALAPSRGPAETRVETGWLQDKHEVDRVAMQAVDNCAIRHGARFILRVPREDF